MTCSNIGADVLGNSKSSYEKSNGGNKRSKSQESADSDKINANSTDSNHSPASNHSYSDSHHQYSHHHQLHHQRSPPSSSKSSGQISFKPYEDVSSGKQHKVMMSSDQVTKCDSKSKDRCSPSRSSSSSSTTKRSSPSMNRSSTSSSTTTNNTSATSTSSNVTKSHESHPSSTSYNSMDSDLLKSSGHLTAAYASLVSQQLKSSQQVCRDPFCTGCQMSSPFSTPGHCCNGLSACIHQNPFASYASALGLANPMASHLAAASRYQNGLSSGIGRPYVCSWTAGGTYCGKNFPTSDELLQHLKSHTSSSNYGGSGTSNPMLGHSMSALGHYPHLDPMLTSPVAGLRRTAFDPVNRFHPYKPFGLPLTQLGSTFNPSLSSLPPHHHSAAAAAAASAGYPWRESLRWWMSIQRIAAGVWEKGTWNVSLPPYSYWEVIKKREKDKLGKSLKRWC